MSAPTPAEPQPLMPGPVRRVFHSLLALGGWVVFGYWWWLVFHRVSSAEIRFTMWFLLVSLVAIVLVTILWALHNLRQFRGRNVRTRVRAVNQDSTHDSVGRPVGMLGIPAECTTASLIVIRIEGGTKVYRPTAVRGHATDRPTGSDPA